MPAAKAAASWPVPSGWALPVARLAAVWFAVAILACLALLAITDYRRDPEDWKRHRTLYAALIVAAVVVTIVAGVVSSVD